MRYAAYYKKTFKLVTNEVLGSVPAHLVVLGPVLHRSKPSWRLNSRFLTTFQYLDTILVGVRQVGGATWLRKEEGDVGDGGDHFLLYLFAEKWGVPVPLVTIFFYIHTLQKLSL